jgi:sugar lactone lactonase YvrE
MRVGDGDFVYELIQDWGTLPAGWRWGAVPEGRVDSQGRVFAFTRSPHPVMAFDPDGRFLFSWGEDIFQDAHGIFIGPDDALYLADQGDHTVRKCTPEGRVLLTLGTPGQPSDTGYDGKTHLSIKRGGPPFNRPTSVALGAHGEIYVADGYGNTRVHVFSPQGELMFSWGEPGAGPGQFGIVHTVCVDHRGIVYVSDRETHRIQVFSPEGRFLDEWTDFHRPNGMFIGVDNNLYVSELFVLPTADHPALPCRISVWTLDGKLLARWGEEDYRMPGSFFAPHGLWGDADGNIYVGELERASNRGMRPADYATVHKLVRVR